MRHLRRAGRGRAGPRRWGGGGRLNHCGCAGGSGPAPSGAAPGPGWTGDSTQWPRVVAAPGAAPRTAADLARPAAASRRAPHWAKGRGAEGAALARQERSVSTPVPVPVPLLTRRCRHGEAAAAHQPLEELLRWRFRGRLLGIRGAPAGHHQGEVAWGARGREERPVLGAVRGTGGADYSSRQELRGSGAGPGGHNGRTTAPGRHCAGGGASGMLRWAAGWASVVP